MLVVLVWREERRKKKSSPLGLVGPQGTEMNFDAHNLGVTSLLELMLARPLQDALQVFCRPSLDAILAARRSWSAS